jgi:ABC-type proline/glycine betaine transport system substrate-binding protein
MKKLFAIVLAVLMIAAFAAPAMAKVKVGGITFVDFYWNEMDGDARNGGRQVG